MLIEGYPVGWAVSAHHPEPFTAFLVDLPGVAMQGRTFAEALAKLTAVTPEILAIHRRDGTLKPPSPEPALQVGSVRWMYAVPRKTDAKEPVRPGLELRLSPQAIPA